MIIDKDLLIHYIERADQEAMLKLYLANQCVGVLEQIKPANLIMIPKDNLKLLSAIGKEQKLSIRVMVKNKDKLQVFLYKKELLSCYLKRSDVSEFLTMMGYRSHLFSLLILQLKHRMKAFYKENNDFPHEIGIFLGYPLVDVVGYIEHKGLNCLEQGYWKVYQSSQETKLQFEQMDQARRKRVYELIEEQRLLE